MAENHLIDFSRLADQISQQDAIEWAGLVTGILYVILATYEKPSCWLYGIISSACIAWKSFTDYFLIADGILQLFYIVIGVVGFFQWVRGASQQQVKPILISPLRDHLLAIAICLLLSWPASYLLVTYADARYGYPDTLLTFLSLWATLLLIRKDLHNWVYWIAIDVVYVVLYWQTEGYLFSILFFIYTGISILGLNQWRRHFIRQ